MKKVNDDTIEQADDETIPVAMDALRLAFQKDDSYALSWHSNIAMACYDSMSTRIACENTQVVGSQTIKHVCKHRIAQEAAGRFMKNCFGIDTEKLFYEATKK